MENASKALIMAAGVLIGLLILSLAVFLFVNFGASSKEVYEQIEEKQLTQYNAQYTVYEGRKDLTIYDVITLLNLQKENENYYQEYTDYDSNYKVEIELPSDMKNMENRELIGNYNNVNREGDLSQKFKCTKIQYNESGRVKGVKIEKVNT